MVDFNQLKNDKKECLKLHKEMFMYVKNYYVNHKYTEWNKGIIRVIQDYKESKGIKEMDNDLFLCYYFHCKDGYNKERNCPLYDCIGVYDYSTLYGSLFLYYEKAINNRVGKDVIKNVSRFFETLDRIISIGDYDEEI